MLYECIKLRIISKIRWW